MQGMAYFFVVKMIVDPFVLSEEDVQSIFGNCVEEFLAFIFAHFEGSLEVTYFFYRVMFLRFGANFKDLIKMLYCLSQMNFEE
jgi:hypothetical protein